MGQQIIATAQLIYIYDKNGIVKGHYSASGQLKLKEFDHYYNKITLGGNRRTGLSTSNTDGRYWIDDFIVNDGRVGPTYFTALNNFQNNPDLFAPSEPSSLNVE